MEGLVCEIDKVSNGSRLAEDVQGAEEATVVSSPKGVNSMT